MYSQWKEIFKLLALTKKFSQVNLNEFCEKLYCLKITNKHYYRYTKNKHYYMLYLYNGFCNALPFFIDVLILYIVNNNTFSMLWWFFISYHIVSFFKKIYLNIDHYLSIYTNKYDFAMGNISQKVKDWDKGNFHKKSQQKSKQKIQYTENTINVIFS